MRPVFVRSTHIRPICIESARWRESPVRLPRGTDSVPRLSNPQGLGLRPPGLSIAAGRHIQIVRSLHSPVRVRQYGCECIVFGAHMPDFVLSWSQNVWRRRRGTHRVGLGPQPLQHFFRGNPLGDLPLSPPPQSVIAPGASAGAFKQREDMGGFWTTVGLRCLDEYCAGVIYALFAWDGFGSSKEREARTAPGFWPWWFWSLYFR